MCTDCAAKAQTSVNIRGDTGKTDRINGGQGKAYCIERKSRDALGVDRAQLVFLGQCACLSDSQKEQDGRPLAPKVSAQNSAERGPHKQYSFELEKAPCPPLALQQTPHCQG